MNATYELWWYHSFETGRRNIDTSEALCLDYLLGCLVLLGYMRGELIKGNAFWGRKCAIPRRYKTAGCLHRSSFQLQSRSPSYFKMVRGMSRCLGPSLVIPVSLIDHSILYYPAEHQPFRQFITAPRQYTFGSTVLKQNKQYELINTLQFCLDEVS